MPPFGKALHRGLDILERLGESRDPLAYGQLRRQVDVSPASFGRFLSILVERGYATRDDDGRYRLGPASAALGLQAVRRLPLIVAAGGVLDELVERTGLSAELVRFEPGRFVFLDRREPADGIVLRARPGSTFTNAPCNAIGLLATSLGFGLADQPIPADRAGAIARDNFAEMVQNRGECWRGASAVLDRSGRPAGCLALAGPAYRIDDGARERYREILTRSAQTVAERLGASFATRSA